MINELAEQMHERAREKGFWEDMQSAVSESTVNREAIRAAFLTQKIALIVSELGELVEALRAPGPCTKIPEITSFEEEYVDTLIRLLDLGGFLNIDIDEVMRLKDEYNSGRPHKHSKLF